MEDNNFRRIILCEKYTEIQIAYEPKARYRYIVQFPKHMKLLNWHTKTVDIPKFIDNRWTNLNIYNTFMCMPENIVHNLINTKKRKARRIFPRFSKNNDTIVIEKVDPTGVTLEKFKVIFDKVYSISFGEFVIDNKIYDDIHLSFSVKSFKNIK